MKTRNQQQAPAVQQHERSVLVYLRYERGKQYVLQYVLNMYLVYLIIFNLY